jgi:SAM-dependent methyltransferase
MVHALEEIKRILVPDGFLIDLRPLLGRWSVEIAWGNDFREVGRLTDLPAGLSDDETANRAMDEASRRNWFTLEQGERFSLFYSWDTANDMEEFLREEWDSFVELDEEVSRAAKSAWAVAEADARVRVRAEMLIDRWRKVG